MKVLKVYKAKVFVFILSLLLLAVGGFFIYQYGFNFGVDFESGITQNVKIYNSDANIASVRESLSSIPNTRVQRSGEAGEGSFNIRTSAKDQAAMEEIALKINECLTSTFGPEVKILSSASEEQAQAEKGFSVLTSSFIGSKFSSSLITTSIQAVAISLVLILIYVWFRFQLAYSIAAIITLIHDVLLLICFISVLKVEISSVTIAAILTIIGYSLNNTIVIFDRIRENINLKNFDNKFSLLVDKSVTQSLTRTLFSSLTTLAVVIPLHILVLNRDIKMFSLVLSIGIAIGIYSSTFVASNILSLVSSSKVSRLTKRSKN